MAKAGRNLGFDGRQFLLEPEWLTYCRRKPVRYTHKAKTERCEVCGEPGSEDNPLQNAHIIGFDVGVIDLALTPDYLDSDENILTAHRKTCNRSTELDLLRSMRRLQGLGVLGLPEFLPASIRATWEDVPAAEGESSIEE